MSLNLFDAHCHLDDPRLQGDLGGVLSRMSAAGVSRCVTIGTSQGASCSAVRIAQEHGCVWASVGVQCEYADKFGEADLVWLRELAARPKVVAIGEIGLDYYWKDPAPEAQKPAFILQLELARELKLPAILHVRDAHEDVLAILNERRERLPQLILHCFGGNADDARRYLELGAYISFAGNLTYKKADALREAASIVPLDRLLVETDAPYLAPEPVRGRTNEPAYAAYTLRRLAELRGTDADELSEVVTANALRVFRIHD
ncbi:MAG: TatD family hydrolase [Oscillospiraceae bacterium]|jgi:TatD DNase family protein|nr:TatD family hydrolase [Oscillospiraceae bacterium]